jgi:hypothetical protein
MFHDTQRFDCYDEFFVIGGNPDGIGGGVIASSPSWFAAVDKRWQAISLGYRDVKVVTWAEMVREN